MHKAQQELMELQERKAQQELMEQLVQQERKEVQGVTGPQGVLQERKAQRNRS